MLLRIKVERCDLIRRKELDGVRARTEEKAKVLAAEAAERTARAKDVERELHVEREWRTSLQESSISNAERISQLRQENDQLKQISEVRYTFYFSFFLPSFTIFFRLTIPEKVFSELKETLIYFSFLLSYV